MVFMLMAFRKVQPDAHGHQHPGSRQPDRDRLSRRQRDQRSEKRCNGKIGPGTGCSQVPQPDNEQRQADTVGQKPDAHRRDQDEQIRQPVPKKQCKRQIDGTRDHPFDQCDPCRVGKRNLARQIAVEAPGQARSEY